MSHCITDISLTIYVTFMCQLHSTLFVTPTTHLGRCYPLLTSLSPRYLFNKSTFFRVTTPFTCVVWTPSHSDRVGFLTLILWCCHPTPLNVVVTPPWAFVTPVGFHSPPQRVCTRVTPALCRYKCVYNPFWGRLTVFHPRNHVFWCVCHPFTRGFHPPDQL